MAAEATQLNPWVSRANALTCAGLAIAIAYVLVRIAYLFVDGSAGNVPPSVYGAASGPVSQIQQRRVDAGAVALWHLFGEEGIKPVAQAQNQEVNAPPTRLSLELQGVFVAPKEEDSTAMISESRRESQLFRIGSKVSGNASLAAVFPDRVLLSINGKMEALYFPDANRGGAGGPGGMSRAPLPGGQPIRSVSARTGRVSELGRPAGAAPMGGMMGADQAREVVKALQAEMGDNPDAVLGQFGLASNSGRGYRITDSSNPALAAVGGRPGDVIVSVNGRAVGDPQADVNLIQEVMESGCAKLTIERSGRQFNAEACPGQ